jgi:DNA-binding CsgD family transcriptional regulator
MPTKFDAPKNSPFGGLTKREREVMEWVVQAKTNIEVGLILGISSRTVAKHLEHIFEKLAIEKRVLLAVNYAELKSPTAVVPLMASSGQAAAIRK